MPRADVRIIAADGTTRSSRADARPRRAGCTLRLRIRSERRHAVEMARLHATASCTHRRVCSERVREARGSWNSRGANQVSQNKMARSSRHRCVGQRAAQPVRHGADGAGLSNPPAHRRLLAHLDNCTNTQRLCVPIHAARVRRVRPSGAKPIWSAAAIISTTGGGTRSARPPNRAKATLITSHHSVLPAHPLRPLDLDL